MSPLVVRAKQVDALASVTRTAFIDARAPVLRRDFPDATASLTDEELRARIAAAVERAASYGLLTRRQRIAYLELAATYGWVFDEAPDTKWMGQILADSSIGDASARLARLVSECQYRRRAAEESARAAKAFDDAVLRKYGNRKSGARGPRVVASAGDLDPVILPTKDVPR